MALTTVEYTYSGQASFAIPFSLGILNRAYVTIQINNQVDGSGDPLYYTNFTWTSDSEVVINGLTNGDIIKIARTIPSNLLLSDYTAGSNITRDNLNIANKQLIMLIHEVLDKNVTQQTKLDTIESGATGDQTAAEIKTAYESNANTNAFTDADESKLDGIEAGADITDTANVTAAGAVMDSEVTDLAGIKAVTVSTLQVKPSEGAFVDGDKTKLNSIEANATADQTNAEIRDAVEAAINSNVFTDSDHSKLDSIETNADVTDTANVVAALTAGTNITIASDGTIASTAAGGGGGVSDIVEDLTPQLGGNLDLNGQDITGTGNISITGTVNGRDVASDGTKLDGIESGATADQTATQIKTAYESNADTNAFTDADHTKLDGIEAAADVTDTANVTAAGALMDSEVTNLAQVKAFDSSDYATAAQGTTADAALPKAGGTMTGDILFNDGVKAKFGNSNDLQIWHNGTDSYVYDTGAGDLILRGSSNIKLQSAGGTALSTFTAAGASTLYYSAAEKLATTSTGIDVIGKIGVGDAGTIADHELHIQSSSPTIRLEDTDGNKRFDITQSGNDTNFDYEANMLFKKSDGTEIFRIDTAGIDVTGKAGINVASPSAYLHIKDDTAANDDYDVQIESFRPNLVFEDISGSATDYQIFVDSNTMKFLYGDASTNTKLANEVLEINTSGLDVTGAIDVATSGASNTSKGLAIATSGTNFESDGGIISIDHAASGAVTGGYFSKYSAGGTLRHSVKGDGKGYFAGGLGIGTTSPTSLMHLASTAPYITFEDTDNNQDWQIQATAWFAIRDQTANAERMRIDSSGRVGIGHTSPVAKMAILGSSNSTITEANSNLCVEGSGGNGLLFGTLNTTGFKSYIQSGFVANLPLATYDLLLNPEGGNVGVGLTAPTAKMHLFTDGIDQSVFSAQTDLGTNNRILTLKSPISDSSSAPYRWQTSNSIQWEIDSTESKSMILNSAGLLGLGTYSPNHELHIESTSPTIRLVDTDNNNTVDFTQSGSATYIDFDNNVRFRNLANAERLRIDSGGIDVTGSTHTTGTSGTRQWSAGSAGQKLGIYSYENSTFYHRLETGNATNYQWGAYDNIPIYTITNNTIRTTLTGDGKFGINTTGPADTLHVEGNVYLGTSSRSVYCGGGGNLRLQTGTGEVKVLTANGATTNLITSGTGINIPANLDVGNALNVGGASTTNTGFIESPVVGPSRALQTVGSVNTTQTHIGFENLSGEIGRIDVSAFSVAYVTSSDYRLKTDIQPMQGSIDRVKALRPVNFEWVNDGGRVDGFIAHEAQEVVPEAISGEKDGMRDKVTVITPLVEATYDDEGNELTPEIPAVTETEQVPDYQGIDQSKLVPLLTSALQDAISKIEELELRIVALEN